MESKLEEKEVEHPDVEEKNKNENIEPEEKDTKFKKTKMKNKKREKQIDQMSEKEEKKKWVKPVIAVVIIAICLLLVSTVFSLFNMGNNKIISGVSIQGIDVSGLEKEEAKAKLQAMYDEKKQKEIGIKYQDYETTLNPTLMEVEYDVDKAVEEAYSIGRNSNIFVNNYSILYTLIAKKEINVPMTLNEDVTKQTIEDIGVNLPGIVIESSYSVEEDELIISKGKQGVKIDTDSLLNIVKQYMQTTDIKEDYITIPVIQKTPDEIDIQAIHDEICKEAQDAYYTKDPFEVHPEVIGISFDVEEAKKILAEEGKEEYIIKLTITKPKVTIDQIGTEAFPDRLGTQSTRYDASVTGRTTNLKIACQKINGKVIMPGETFSYNKTLGPRTAAAGYKDGKVYENGQVVDGIGGGICQISSTLYNAVLFANLEIVERRNHQFVTSYLPAGRDATVVYGMTDFKFKNTRKYPIRLVASCNGGVATVSVFGIKEENEYVVSLSVKTVATIPYSTQYIQDSSLASGVEVVKQKGANGVKTETYITKTLNGKVVSTNLLSKDTYDAMARIVARKGAGSTTQAPSTNNNNNPAPTPSTPAAPEVPTTPETPTTPTVPETPTTPETLSGSEQTPSTKPSENVTE